MKKYEGFESMSDRELLVHYLTKISRGFREHDGRNLVLRNGRWGTCGNCPRSTQGVCPEDCVYTARYDHNIHSTHGGKFFEYDKGIPKSMLTRARAS